MRNYSIVKSAPYCCVPSCIEMVLRRHGYNEVTQYDIANSIGIYALRDDDVTLPKELINVKYTSDFNMVGMHLYKDTLNKCFEFFKLPFKETYIHWNEISDYNISALLSAISDKNDAILFFDFGYLFHEKNDLGIGHAVVFSSLNEKGDVSFVNPGPGFIGQGQASSDEVYYAIRARQGGISVISSK